VTLSAHADRHDGVMTGFIGLTPGLGWVGCPCKVFWPGRLFLGRASPRPGSCSGAARGGRAGLAPKEKGVLARWPR
jgi:hypothetical protein